MIVVLLVSNLLASFTQSLMNVALDYVATDFHITLSQANWMVLAFTIVTATTITMAAKLLERIGLHKLMTIGFVFSFVGSLLGFFAWNYPVMIVARALQAVCTGLCFPLINEALLTIAPKGKGGDFARREQRCHWRRTGVCPARFRSYHHLRRAFARSSSFPR